MADWDDVRRLALALPGTAEGFSHANAAWRVHGKLFAWERPLRPADLRALGDAAPDGPILGVRVEHELAKHALIATDPEVFFTTPHFDGYAAVLVALAAIEPTELAEVITESWLIQAPARVAAAFMARRPGGSPR